MAKAGTNSLGRLTEVMFEEIERLNRMDGTDREALAAEVERCKAMQGIAREINTSAKTVLETARMRAEMEGASKMVAPKMLEG